MNLSELETLEQRELYRKHFLATLELARIVQSDSWIIYGTRVYFCLDLGLKSEITRAVEYRGKTVEYLELYGGHICATTFKNLPYFSQHNLPVAAKVIIDELRNQILLQDDYLHCTYFIGNIDGRIRDLCVKHRFPDTIEFCERVKYTCSFCRCRTPKYLQNVDYYTENSDYYKNLINKSCDRLLFVIQNNLKLESREHLNFVDE